jgi:hypothetical protein
MDGGPLALFMVCLFVGLIVFVLLLGQFHPKSGREILDWKPTRSPETEAQNEVDDVAQMLAGINRRRAARGREQLTEQGLEREVRAEQRAQSERRDAHLLDAELAEVLDARNARRRRRGEPEMTLDELRASLEDRPR